MTTIAVRSAHYGFRQVAGMEWIKLRSLRSTWLTLALTIAAAAGVGAAVGANTKDVSEHPDLTNNVLGGIAPGLLLIGVLGVLCMTSEYTSGMIRASLAAAPNRRLLLGAKAAMFGAVALAIGEVASFTAFLAGSHALPGRVPAPSLGQPGVLRAVLMAGAAYCLIGLLGLGLGAVIRHGAAALGALVGGVYVAAQFLAVTAHQLQAFVPVLIVGNSLSTTKRLEGTLSPWAGLGVLSVYAAAALGVGGWLLVRRDA
jgi:ABC-2 type transport system permease protein